MDQDSPNYQWHKRWVDALVATPSPNKGEVSALTTSPLQTEHVLRGSKSFAARSYRSRQLASSQPFRVPSTTSNKENQSTHASEYTPACNAPLLKPPAGDIQVLGQIAGNGQVYRVPPWRVRRSPTPSIRKKRAEAIVKAHGSPTHVRVTAGGRIVPSEQSPLCHPRYGYSAIKANGGLIKFAPNHPMGKAQWTTATSTTENGFLVQDPEGKLCQIINGQILPLPEVGGALRLHMPAPNLSVTAPGQTSQPSASRHLPLSGLAFAEASSNNQPLKLANAKHAPSETADPSTAQQQSALQLEYAKLEQELKELDRAEVIHGRSMGKVAKDALIGKRRELVITMDKVRKAIKSLKETPQLPSVPNVASNVYTGSARPPHSPRGRVPQHPRREGPSLRPTFDTLPSTSYAGAYHPDETSHLSQISPQEMFAAFGYNPIVPPANMYIPPPPLDGSMVSPYFPLDEQHMQQQPVEMSAGFQSASVSAHAQQPSNLPPQSDGSTSIKDFRDVQLPTSPRQSRALPIKDPNVKEATSTLKLNPMSPAYTPTGGDSISASPRHSPVSIAEGKPAKAIPPPPAKDTVPRRKHQTSENTFSPLNRSSHAQSSSTSSYSTADFFPNDTQEYSTRHHGHQDFASRTSDKKNVDRDHHDCSQRRRASTPTNNNQQLHLGHRSMETNAHDFRLQAPPVPPGTPIEPGSAVSSQHLSMAGNVGSIQRRSDLSDPSALRQCNNMSPKNMRQEWLFIHESENNIADYSSSSPDPTFPSAEELRGNVTVNEYEDDSNKTPSWREGFTAGLNRIPVASDRAGDYLDGYCIGLLRSKPKDGPGQSSDKSLTPTSTSATPQPPSSIQDVRVPRSSGRLKTDRRGAMFPRPTIEASIGASDTFKQACLAPQNENVILTPAADGPHVDQLPFRHERSEHAQDGSQPTKMLLQNLRSGSDVSSFPFPSASASFANHDIVKPLPIVSALDSGATNHCHEPASTGPSARPAPQIKIPAASPKSLSSVDTNNIQQSRSTSPASNRICSMTSIDSNLYLQYPGPRVFSPHLEWKSASSVAQAAGLAAGSFAPHPQVDGASRDILLCGRDEVSSGLIPSRNLGAQQHGQEGRISSTGIISPTSSRFKEGSIDGMSSPPMSPPTSPKSMPSAGKKKNSPSKSSSPAKHKFEQIAGKVGLKVTAAEGAKDKAEESGAEPVSPQGKRRWRDLWKNARKDGI